VGLLYGSNPGHSVALIVKKHASAAGLNAANFARHSLRAGVVTVAVIAGASERSIMNQRGHHSSAMIRRYVRDASLFRQNAAAVGCDVTNRQPRIHVQSKRARTPGSRTRRQTTHLPLGGAGWVRAGDVSAVGTPRPPDR
jgi:hypothetical protein